MRTRARATGVGWATGAGRIGATVAPFIVALLVRVDVQSVLRTIGIVRARAKIGLQNLVYNVCRDARADGYSMRVKFACAGRMVAPDGYSGAALASICC